MQDTPATEAAGLHYSPCPSPRQQRQQPIQSVCLTDQLASLRSNYAECPFEYRNYDYY